MTEQDFFAYCKAANSADEMRNGDGVSVRLLFPEGDSANRYYIQFYPRFTDSTIQRLVGTIRHEAWAPWNEQFFPNAILEPVSQIIAREAGGMANFKLDVDADVPTLVKRDGTRQIILRAAGQQTIELIIEDLSGGATSQLATPGPGPTRPTATYPIKDVQ